MFFSISFYMALALFGIGLIYKISTWFRYAISLEAEKIPTSTRIVSGLKGIAVTLFSLKVLTLIKVFVLDVLLQLGILRQDFLRWLMHICIFGGFLLLLLMHALETYVSAALFSDYYATINPFIFLRNLFGAMVIIGIGIALYRRFILKVPRLTTTARDHYAIIILAVIMISGVLLEGSKIISYTRYQEMVEDYAGEDDEETLNSLEAYWVNQFGVISPNVKGPFDEETLELGKETHEMGCMECHARPQWAFLGYGTAKIMAPAAPALDRANLPDILWYIHFLACWIGLAYLPFSKMFHILASPLSLMSNAVMDAGKSDPANITTRQVMELDACTHCCTCSLNCSAGVLYDHFSNANILPSEKLNSIKALATGKKLDAQTLEDIREGVYLCTNCKRCTVVCPSGINLQDLWFNVRESLLQQGYAEFLTLSSFSFYRGLMKDHVISGEYPKPLQKARAAIAARCDLMGKTDKILSVTNANKTFKQNLSLSGQADTFLVCFDCRTCSSVCPVVANYDDPVAVLGLLPHQIMHSCGLGIKDLALGSNMLWDCLTCYKCQEHCPQGVCITDVLYELKNEAVRYVKEQSQDDVGKR